MTVSKKSSSNIKEKYLNCQASFWGKQKDPMGISVQQFCF